MFTGLVETIGVVRRLVGSRDAARAQIVTSLRALELGESVNIDGVCLTVDRILRDGFEADLSSETLAVSTLSSLAPGARVHVERATPLGGRMGGHTVLGHVDGVGLVRGTKPIGRAIGLTVSAPFDLARYLAPKGSIAISGVSLTLNTISDARPPASGANKGSTRQGGTTKRAAGKVEFEVMLVPHTLSKTTLGSLAPGSKVNIEVDVLARYVMRQLEVGVTPASSAWASAHAARQDEEEKDDVDDTRSGHDERILAKLRAGGYT